MSRPLSHPKRPFDLPRFEVLPEAARQSIVAIEAALDGLASSAASRPDAGLDLDLTPRGGAFPCLTHDLSFHFPARERGFSRCDRAMIEWARLRSHWDPIGLSLKSGSAAAFVDGLCNIAESFSGVRGLRHHAVRTRLDRGGHYVLYPPSAVIGPRLRQLFAMLSSEERRPRPFNAVLALVWLTHCHPFADGNGRTARVLFNMLLQGDFDAPRFYLPLYELAGLSRGGYIVRIRAAELHGDWSPLFEYIGNVVHIWSDRVRSDSASTSAAHQGVPGWGPDAPIASPAAPSPPGSGCPR